MPQINQLADVFLSQWFWLLLTLALIYFGIGKAMLPKIEATVDARDRKIADDLAAAESARSAADETEERWRKAMTDARAEAQVVAAKAKAKGAADAEKRVKKANDDIAAKAAEADAVLAKARAEALASIESVAADAAQEMVVKLSGAKVTAAAARAAVQEELANG